MTTSTVERYDAVARLLHWLVVLLVAAQFVIGWTMPDIHHDTKPDGLIGWHITIGAALIAAMVLRVLWRITHRPPPDQLTPQVRLISGITHWGLYVALIVVPLLGWINASWRGWSIKLFGALPYPSLASAGDAYGNPAGDIHGTLTWVLLALIGLHVAGALYHRIVLRDRVLERMLP